MVLGLDPQGEAVAVLTSDVELMLAFDVQGELHSQHLEQLARHPRLNITVSG